MSKWKTTRNITTGVYNGAWKARRPVTFLFGWYVVRMLICQRQNASKISNTQLTRRAGDVNREGGTESANRRWLQPTTAIDGSSQPGLGYSEFFP
jgi:hypothetical protein